MQGQTQTQTQWQWQWQWQWSVALAMELPGAARVGPQHADAVLRFHSAAPVAVWAACCGGRPVDPAR